MLGDILDDEVTGLLCDLDKPMITPGPGCAKHLVHRLFNLGDLSSLNK